MASNMAIAYKLLFAICLWKVSIQSTSLRQTFTLYSNPNKTTSWGNASKICQTVGGQLLKMNSKLKYHVLSYLATQPPFNYSLNQDDTYWIGLHINEETVNHCGEVNFFWNDCEPLSPVWTKWSGGETNNCDTDRCVEIHDLKWKTQSCSQPQGFLCESQQDTECSYKDVTVDYLTELDFAKIQNVTFSANFHRCQHYCSTTLVNLHWQCWMFQAENSSLTSEPEECILYYSEEQVPVYQIQPGVNVTNGTTYYVRDCFTANVELNYIVDALETTNDQLPNTSCPVIDGDCYFESISTNGFAEVVSSIHQELDIRGDKKYCKDKCLQMNIDGRKCWFIDLFSEISEMCRLYFLNNEIHQNFWKAEIANRPSTLLVKRCLKHEDTTTQPITTTTTTLNLQQLLVDKTSTSNYRNKFISVYESAASKVVSGVVGSLFIGILIGTIVISDLKTLGTHATTIGLRNIKRRNICFPNKKQKIKSKPHVITD